MGAEFARHIQTFKIETDNEGGRSLTTAIPVSSIEPSQTTGRKRKKSEFSTCLVIGFDTEYQSHTDLPVAEAKEKAARNEVLSYQFSVKLVSAGTNDAEPVSCEGIIIPGKDDRIQLADFIAFAIGSLIEKFPTVRVPSNIYLVGHFTKADLPGFAGFAGTAKKFMSNVRNTFVSVDSSMPIAIEHDDGTEAKLSVRMRDTILLAPAGMGKLASIGEMLGLEKIKLADTVADEIAIKGNMTELRDTNWELFREYAIRDAEICTRYAERLIRQNHDLFGTLKLPVTLTSFGTELVLTDWSDNDMSTDDALGQETVVEKVFSKHLGYPVPRTVHPFRENVHFENPFVSETYHGGRNEQFLFGIADEANWRDHDLSSAYPTAMSLIGLPKWDDLQINVDHRDTHTTDLAYFSVDFEFPDTIRFPTMPVRTNNGIIFPRRGHSLCAAPELHLAEKLGAKINVRRSVLVPTDRSSRLFQRFIQSCLAKRLEHQKGSFENLFWKEVGNSTYGKTAQGLTDKRVYDLRSDDMVKLPPSPITQPFFASFITSFTRAVLGEILNGFSSQVDVFSVTTDGFLSNASDAEIDRVMTGRLFRMFSDARRELSTDGDPLEIKHNVKRPIGWRTRGSATLVPGDGDKGYVLQKGGLKTNESYNTEEENRQTVSQFFNRHPEAVVTYRSAMTLKDVVRGDIDMTYHQVEKRVSMEFDWKRKPVRQREVEVEFEGKAITHLTFDTEPMTDHSEFASWRDAWDLFNKKPRRNLKSLRDLSDFVTFQATKSYPSLEVTKYLRKADGDLKRLRQDLTIAFRRQQAGFDKVIGRLGHIPFQQFCETLEACGIPCKVTDVDNVRNKAFKPNRTVPTDRVRQAIERLKVEFYPELEIETILTEDNPNETQKTAFSLAAE